MHSVQTATVDPHRSAEGRGRTARRHFTPKETQIVEALYTLGLTDDFIGMFLHRSTMGTFNKRCRIGLSRLRDDNRADALRPKFRMSQQARDHLHALEGPDSWLCQCLDAFPQFVTSYVATDAYATGIANDSR
jgi:hypothetical protein